MSWWNEVTKPVNKALDSNAFKAVFPVQALANGAVTAASKVANINGGKGLTPTDQYAIGAGTGTLLGAGSALYGAATTPEAASGAGTPAAPASTASAWENHAIPGRQTSDDYQEYRKKSNQPQLPAMPQIGAPLPGIGGSY